MINISNKVNPELYSPQYQKCLDFLKTINNDDYTYPENTNFFTSSEIKTDKELMVVKSFLATQNLERTELTLWCEYDISNNELIKPYLDYINMKVIDLEKESKNTILENHKCLKITDDLHYIQSGLLRFLAIHNYGGIWVDMDMVFLRDFKPILDQEFAYMWETFTDFTRKNPKNYGPCAAIVSGHKDSKFTNLCLEKINETNIRPKTACLDHELLAKVYSQYEFTVFPSCFFNTEWQMTPQEAKGITDGWFDKNKYSNNLYLEAFSWHWHNSYSKRFNIAKGSKFNLLQNLIDEKLIEKNIIK